MSAHQTDQPFIRRTSFSTTLAHRHQSIPNSSSSDPNNPVPCEPKSTLRPVATMPGQDSVESSPRSSGDTRDILNDDSSDLDTDASTPPQVFLDGEAEEKSDKMAPLPRRMSESQSQPRIRRASVTYGANSEEIKRLLGDGKGTTFLERYCCGKGCCKLQALRPTEQVSMPALDNDAFRFLGVSIEGLNLDTNLTQLPDMPEQNITFSSVRRDSIPDKFPAEARHGHDAETVRTYPPEYMKPHPPYSIFNAPVYGARELTKPGAEKRTFHFDIDVTDYPEEGGVDFKVGGAVGVCPPNDPAVVEELLDHLGIPRFQRDKPIRLHTKGGRWPTIWGDEDSRELLTTRREVLTWTIDISSTPPTKPLLRTLAEHATDINEKKILNYLCSAQGQAAFCDLRTGAHITLQQLLYAFPSSKPSLEELCNVSTQLMPRFYSLSNDPHVSSARDGLAGRRLIETAVTIHETPAQAGTLRTGVGSGFLERIAKKFIQAEVDAEASGNPSNTPGAAGRALNLQIPMFRGLMANPLSKDYITDGPMVLIGAGVGMAPFRGFILNRLKNANCANKIWLIQGIRDSMLDEIYQGELGDHEREIKKVVQSRAQTEAPPVSADEAKDGANKDDNTALLKKESKQQRKVAKYVQDEVRLQADVVWFVINSLDGRVFVCGSTKGMGEGVERALIDVAMDKGNLDLETARQFWKDKQDGGQYIAETW